MLARFTIIARSALRRNTRGGQAEARAAGCKQDSVTIYQKMTNPSQRNPAARRRGGGRERRNRGTTRRKAAAARRHSGPTEFYLTVISSFSVERRNGDGVLFLIRTPSPFPPRLNRGSSF